MGNIKSKSIILGVVALAGSFLFGNIFFSHPAYAASYINVSSGSGGTVSFGSIKPTSTGTSATASDTLTVHTDCSVGYSVYVSGQDGKDTNLTNKSVESDNIIATSSNSIGSAGSLGSNTWGLNYENTGTYVGLPTYSDSTNKAFTTKTYVAEESTVPIYYGIKVDTSITPGTYTGDVLYTVLMDSSCQAYTVIFNSNGGTGTMANQSIMAGTTTALTTNSFTRTNYTFLGWSKSANGKTGTATNGIGTEADVDYTDKAKVTDLTAGGGSITLYAIWKENDHWTINYSSNDADSGSPNKTTEGKVYSGSITMPTVGTMKKSGYDFKGWALTFSATSATYTANQTVTLSNLLAAASSSGQTTTSGSTITLYPVWEKTVTYMQNWGYNECSKLSTNQIVTLRDSRDNNDYAVKKLADGRCWMVQNLRLVGSRTLTPSNSDVSSNFTLTASTPNPDTTNWCTTYNNDASCLDKSQVYYDSSEALDTTKSSYYGALYSWYAATAGTGKSSTSSGTATSSICPKGWRLPTGGPNGEFVALDIAWGGTGENRNSANTYNTFTNTYTSGNNGGFGLAGGIYSSMDDVSLYGYYWSSVANSSSTAYSLYLYSKNTDMEPQTSRYRFTGNSVRCITRDTRTLSGITYMQDVNYDIVSNTAKNAYAQLTDKRDSNKYYVKKLADGKLWMVQNLRLVGSRKLTPTDSDVSSDFTLTASTADPNTTNWCTDVSDYCHHKTQVYWNSSEASDSGKSSYYGALYNWYTATAGTGLFYINKDPTSSICPKGWRLPRGHAGGNTINEFVVLDLAWGGTGESRNSANTYGTFIGSSLSGNSGRFGLSGRVRGSILNVGDTGFYWTSRSNSYPGNPYSYSYSLMLFGDRQNGVQFSVSDKFEGLAVRCLASP